MKWTGGVGYRTRLKREDKTRRPLLRRERRTVELGCGRRKEKIEDQLVVGVDRLAVPGVDILTDLDDRVLKSWHWAERDSCALVICHQTLEHLRNLIPVMNEIWRICDHDAYVETVVPYGVGKPAIQDPTHVRFFTDTTFRYWEPGFVESFGDYGIEGCFAICGQGWVEEGNLWTLLHPLKLDRETLQWQERKKGSENGIVRWPAPAWLMDRRPRLLGYPEA